MVRLRRWWRHVTDVAAVLQEEYRRGAARSRKRRPW